MYGICVAIKVNDRYIRVKKSQLTEMEDEMNKRIRKDLFIGTIAKLLFTGS